MTRQQQSYKRVPTPDYTLDYVDRLIGLRPGFKPAPDHTYVLGVVTSERSKPLEPIETMEPKSIVQQPVKRQMKTTHLIEPQGSGYSKRQGKSKRKSW